MLFANGRGKLSRRSFTRGGVVLAATLALVSCRPGQALINYNGISAGEATVQAAQAAKKAEKQKIIDSLPESVRHGIMEGLMMAGIYTMFPQNPEIVWRAYTTSALRYAQWLVDEVNGFEKVKGLENLKGWFSVNMSPELVKRMINEPGSSAVVYNPDPLNKRYMRIGGGVGREGYTLQQKLLQVQMRGIAGFDTMVDQVRVTQIELNGKRYPVLETPQLGGVPFSVLSESYELSKSDWEGLQEIGKQRLIQLHDEFGVIPTDGKASNFMVARDAKNNYTLFFPDVGPEGFTAPLYNNNAQALQAAIFNFEQSFGRYAPMYRTSIWRVSSVPQLLPPEKSVVPPNAQELPQVNAEGFFPVTFTPKGQTDPVTVWVKSPVKSPVNPELFPGAKPVVISVAQDDGLPFRYYVDWRIGGVSIGQLVNITGQVMMSAWLIMIFRDALPQNTSELRLGAGAFGTDLFGVQSKKDEHGNLTEMRFDMDLLYDMLNKNGNAIRAKREVWPDMWMDDWKKAEAVGLVLAEDTDSYRDAVATRLTNFGDAKLMKLLDVNGTPMNEYVVVFPEHDEVGPDGTTKRIPAELVFYSEIPDYDGYLNGNPEKMVRSAHFARDPNTGTWTSILDGPGAYAISSTSRLPNAPPPIIWNMLTENKTDAKGVNFTEMIFQNAKK